MLFFSWRSFIQRAINVWYGRRIDILTYAPGDVDAKESIKRANERVKQSTASAFAKTAAGYTTITPESTSITLRGGKTKYVLYPVWLLNTTWNNKQYTFAMNGQSGKFVGDLPIDKKAALLWTIGLSALCAGGAFGIANLLWMIF